MGIRAEDSVAYLRPDVAATWHPARNALAATEVRPTSLRKVWWRCEHGHEFQQVVRDRLAYGCPYCRGALPTATNNLAAACPELAREWHRSLNGTGPEDVVPGSRARVWWACARCGHVWRAQIALRTRRGTGCPECARAAATRTRWTPKEPFTATHPDVSAQWHPERNDSLAPGDFTSGSHRKVWWQCGEGHAWQAEIRSRCSHRTGCPYCSGRLAIPSRSLASAHPHLAAQWHPTRNGSLGPDAVTPASNRRVWWRCADCGLAWRAAIHMRSLRDTGCPGCAHRIPTPTYNLAVCDPVLASQWHPTRNGDTAPSDVLPSSHRTYWWRCPAGHEWRSSPDSRSRPTDRHRRCAVG